jgi:hypothetical protein
MQDVSAAEIYGTPTTRMIEGLWDMCATFMEQRRALFSRQRGHKDLLKAVQPVGADQPDPQLGRAVAAEATMPRFLYLNTKQWEQEAPPDLVNFVYQMGLQVRTSTLIPPDTAHLTRDEFPPDEIGKALTGGRKMPRFA